MSILPPSGVVHPFKMQVEFRVGALTHTVNFSLENPTYFSQFYTQIMRGLQRECHLFLNKVLQPRPPESPAPGTPPDQPQENIT